MNFTKTLLAWYDANARKLPWRENKDPYRVWISEIMLQQTRVAAVIPYYARFMEALPSVRDLAGVSEEILMKLWQGLGYYSRAANLKKAAQVIMEQHGGVFPREVNEILELPGIGPYTAGAVSSIAFSKPEAAVDGNVLRIFSRILMISGDIGSSAVKRGIAAEVQKRVSRERPGDFNQGLMDLGATICLPGKPLCPECPVEKFCAARKCGRQQELPVKTAKKSREIKEYTVLIIESGDRIALEKRPPDGLLKDLWQFPLLEGCVESQYYVEDMMEEKGNPIRSIKEGPCAKHLFSHQEWRMKSYILHMDHIAAGWTWATRLDIQEKYSIPSAFSKYLEYIKNN
ncbi:A/G-specific adenine glycosylase [Parasporobacterium paucivorans]|uniref:Adenine DNA glycosylase n=1 Tax=Parasporobacterium paucivorans DSM 15970 TaxID=1122934 RepID=A0A1M6KJS6_9FIRM|nr:A/G-specific adenine glycosylase [Parasporobacterium paucivorans]SHJ59202.1 A/G-specific DNA-adenine glycosylase [Parasporobacterium paucivorans DSM 15970]